MEKNTEKKILEELKNINNSLEEINEKIDYINAGGDESTLWDTLKTLLIGLILVGPVVAIILVIWQIIQNWILN